MVGILVGGCRCTTLLCDHGCARLFSTETFDIFFLPQAIWIVASNYYMYKSRCCAFSIDFSS